MPTAQRLVMHCECVEINRRYCAEIRFKLRSTHSQRMTLSRKQKLKLAWHLAWYAARIGRQLIAKDMASNQRHEGGGKGDWALRVWQRNEPNAMLLIFHSLFYCLPKSEQQWRRHRQRQWQGRRQRPKLNAK